MSRMEARLPKVKDFLTQKKQSYKLRAGSTEDDEKEECAICLAEFTEEGNDQVVVLDCGTASKVTIEE